MPESGSRNRGRTFSREERESASCLSDRAVVRVPGSFAPDPKGDHATGVAVRLLPPRTTGSHDWDTALPLLPKRPELARKGDLE
ncbi:hypothetical protein Pan44_28150 [Caulifigura coniformis]|uniref:Uncharacterized protein n=1 Tax=Caulifigura coniformis TaxID=2527983 RepID=A0A517SF95_9PLAN|nr:hypothetical protein Pan44_28150 [Caulifigura coniformis]